MALSLEVAVPGGHGSSGGTVRCPGGDHFGPAGRADRPFSAHTLFTRTTDQEPS
jgi:hypothetical protein